MTRIKSHDRIGFGMVAAEPMGFLSQLHTIADRVEDVSLFGALMVGDYEWLRNPAYAGRFKHEAWFYGALARGAHKSHHGATPVPNNLHRAGRGRYEVSPLNVLVTTVSSMDEHGYFSMSLSACHERWVLESAGLVIVEVNQNTPKCFGDTLPHVSQVDWIVETHKPVFDCPTRSRGRRRRPSPATWPRWWRTAPPFSWASAAFPTPWQTF